eukprot:scaffold388_cov380-Prasinococcus_capsulatus_cf.AAC.40
MGTSVVCTDAHSVAADGDENAADAGTDAGGAADLADGTVQKGTRGPPLPELLVDSLAEEAAPTDFNNKWDNTMTPIQQTGNRAKNGTYPRFLGSHQLVGTFLLTGHEPPLIP